MGELVHPLFSGEKIDQPPIIYAPTCSLCLTHLVYDGQHQMHCPHCGQEYSSLVPPENYLDALLNNQHDALLRAARGVEQDGKL